MDPTSLIDTTNTVPLPAPMWFIQLFKVLGFTLHLVPMNIWYAGTLLAMVLYVQRNEHARRAAVRLMTQMPVIIAFGVNFGIVPLLFIQVAYGKFFYPATILMAWFWFAVFGVLIVAYYGVYLYAFALKDNARGMTTFRLACGWASAISFLVLGFLFANAMTLMTNVEGWSTLLEHNNVAGAATGTALNVGDPKFFPRWLMLFGMAITTTAAWIGFDSSWFANWDTPEYRRWARRFAWKLYLLGMIWFAAAGSWYVFGTWSEPVRQRMWSGPLAIHTVLTGASPGLTWLLLLWLSRTEPGRGRLPATLVGLAQFGVLGINAVSRQIVQNTDLSPYTRLLWLETEPQWGILLIFVASFVFGLALIGWMVAQVIKAPAQATP